MTVILVHGAAETLLVIPIDTGQERRRVTHEQMGDRISPFQIDRLKIGMVTLAKSQTDGGVRVTGRQQRLEIIDEPVLLGRQRCGVRRETDVARHLARPDGLRRDGERRH